MDDLMGYFIIGGILIGAVIILYLPVFFLLKGRVSVIRQLSIVLLAACSCIVLYATIISAWGQDAFHPAQHHLNLLPLRMLDESGGMLTDKMVVQIFANILMFIPCGFLLPIVFSVMRSFGRTALMIFFASFSIEFVQYFLGAAADIDDVILNLLGGILGYVLFAGGSRYLQRKHARLKLSGGNHYR